MAKLLTLLLAALLILPLASTPVEAKVKGSSAQIHVVKQGDTLYEIAQRHGLTIKQLQRLNGLNSSRLKIGQKLALDRAAAPPLPQTAKSTTAKKSATAKHDASKTVYVVRKGDSLYNIARSHGITVKQLQQLNGLSGSRLKIGQKLALSSTPGQEPVAETAAARAEKQPLAVEQHVVRKGETLSTIARRHHTTVNELKRLNGLRTTRLQIGQRLALAEPAEERSPLLLPGDSGEDEILSMAYSSSSELEQAAFNFLSTPYRFGGNSRKGIDCSAFVQQVFREVDVDLPRSAREQFRVGAKIDRDELEKGDLIFFRTYAKFPSHVGIYLGDGKMIHASSRSRRVVVTSINHPYYQKRFIGAKRITLLDDEEEQLSAGVVDEALEDAVESAAAPVEVANALSDFMSTGPVSNNVDVVTPTVTVTAEPASIQKQVDVLPPTAPPVN
jgi:LysM repeat protein